MGNLKTEKKNGFGCEVKNDKLILKGKFENDKLIESYNNNIFCPNILNMPNQSLNFNNYNNNVPQTIEYEVEITYYDNYNKNDYNKHNNKDKNEELNNNSYLNNLYKGFGNILSYHKKTDEDKEAKDGCLIF